MKARFCAQCGEEVVVRGEDGRDREVCPRCGTVFYVNPLPVVASVVLDHERRVLLVRRGQEPHEGMWCLPIGFAEIGETIQDAALRELREEAGIEGQVRILLDVDSFESSHYGDLLIVSFEVEKTGGREVAGDDAVDVGYFSLDDLPPLAFPSNDRAIEACAARHEEEWRIQDSFHHLRERRGELLSDPLVEMIEQHASEIARRWAREMLAHPTTVCLRGRAPDLLEKEATTALSRLGSWLRVEPEAQAPGVMSWGAAEVRAFYRTWGAERARTGCAAHEVLSSLSLLKRSVYDFAHEVGVWERPADLYRVVELMSRIGAFFDRAQYHAARGFEDVRDSSK
ncbi:MAG TPA: NUDIX hydrolase [Thermoleophilia bacterium]|nr:NUDIX hydrolase [Thermoleophilia bacterium]